MLKITEEMKVTGRQYHKALADYQRVVFEHLFQTEIPPFGTNPNSFGRLPQFEARWESDAAAQKNFADAAAKANPGLVPYLDICDVTGSDAKSFEPYQTQQALYEELRTFFNDLEKDGKASSPKGRG